MGDPDKTELVERWRSLFKRYNTSSLPGSEKAQILKEMLTEIEFHRKLGRMSEQCYQTLNTKYMKEYLRLSQGKKENTRPNGTGSGNLNQGKSQNTKLDERKVVNSKKDEERTEHVPRSKSDDVISKICDVTQEPMTSQSSTAVSKPSNDSPDFEQDVVIEKVKKLDIPSKPKSDQSLLSLWSIARKEESKDSVLLSRPEKRKHVSDSPVSKKRHEDNPLTKNFDFLTAGEQLRINEMKRNGGRQMPSYPQPRPPEPSYPQPPRIPDPEAAPQYGKAQKSLGTRRGLSSAFIPPIPGNRDSNPSPKSANSSSNSKDEEKYTDPIYQDERLKSCEPRMIELILNEILDSSRPMSWDDIAGLEFAKKTIQEIVVWPMLRPDIFTGLRGPPKGLLLFGPPGNGKTLIGKCIASQSNSTFFTISASSLTSKWVGEGEKMVRTLFAVARCHQPAVVFIDEVDSLLTQRSDQEHESSRRIKTEFLVQLDGACTGSDERLLVIGATNRPQEIDEAARRRFVKRLYIPLPESKARCKIVRNLLTDQKFELNDGQFETIGSLTGGYSGSDMANLCREAALGPIRSIPFDDIHRIAAEDVRPINFDDFSEALEQVKASVSDKDLDLYTEWNNKFGSGRR